MVSSVALDPIFWDYRITGLLSCSFSNQTFLLMSSLISLQILGNTTVAQLLITPLHYVAAFLILPPPHHKWAGKSVYSNPTSNLSTADGIPVSELRVRFNDPMTRYTSKYSYTYECRMIMEVDIDRDLVPRHELTLSPQRRSTWQSTTSSSILIRLATISQVDSKSFH